MSSETTSTRRAQRTRRQKGAFGRGFAIVLAVLLVAGVAGAAISLTQGPRASQVVIDTQAVAEASGQRIVFTANQPLAPIRVDQISVSPEAPFSLEASGRTIAVQFTYPLDADSEYTVTIAGVTGAGGGPSATLAHTFRTETPPLYVLQRRQDEDDAVFSTDLGGQDAVPVFTAAQIEDFRAARTGLVVQTTDASGAAVLTAVTYDGSETTRFAMPGEGTLLGLQAADHDGLVGYTYTDLTIGDSDAIESTLYIADLDDPGAEPRRVDVGEDPRVVQWAFVPQTSGVLVLTFDGQLWLVDVAQPDADPVPLGAALGIYGIERGSGSAIVERSEGTVVIDLTSLDETPLAEADGAADIGIPGPIVPVANGQTLRIFTLMGEDGFPAAQSVVQVGRDGSTMPVLTLTDPGDSVMQVCASPSGQYAAVIIAPDLVDNPYDTYLRPLPTTLETHLVDVRDGSTVSVLAGGDLSWCVVGT